LANRARPCDQRGMTGPDAALLSVLMLAAFALTIGGLYLVFGRKQRKQGLLMLLAAVVALANVLIWTA
jgi:hypothetical protein